MNCLPQVAAPAVDAISDVCSPLFCSCFRHLMQSIRSVIMPHPRQTMGLFIANLQILFYCLSGLVRSSSVD